MVSSVRFIKQIWFHAEIVSIAVVQPCYHISSDQMYIHTENGMLF